MHDPYAVATASDMAGTGYVSLCECRNGKKRACATVCKTRDAVNTVRRPCTAIRLPATMEPSAPAP